MGLNSLSLYKNLFFSWVIPVGHNECAPEVPTVQKGCFTGSHGPFTGGRLTDFPPALAVGLAPFSDH